MKVGAFVEDAAHASFIVALVRRLADPLEITVEIELRNALGGRGAVIGSLRKYVRDVARGRDTFAELLVVAIDGNCQGSQEVRRAILDVASAEHFAGQIACAVPNPHIELWYLADGQAVHTVIGASGSQPALPPHKCEKSRYKTLLREAFLDGDIDPPAGGSEYGEEIASALDLDRARSADADFDRFVGELSAAMRALIADPATDA